MNRLQFILLPVLLCWCSAFSQPKNLRSIPLSKLNLAGHAEITVKQNTALLFDKVNNRAVIIFIDPTTDTITQYWDFKGNLFPHKQLLRKTDYDSVLYEQQRPALVKNGDASATILSVFADDSSGYLLLSFPLPRMLPEKNAYIPEPTYFIYKRHFFNGKKELRQVEINSMSKNIQLSAKSPFFVSASKPMLPVVDSSGKKLARGLFSAWHKTANDFFMYDSTFLPFSLSEQKQTHPDSVRLRLNPRFIFTENAALVYDRQTIERISIKTVSLFNYSKLLDLQKQGDRLLLLVNKPNKLEAMIYDRQLEQIFGQVPLLLPPNCQLNSARFCNGNSLVVLSTDKKTLFLVMLETQN